MTDVSSAPACCASAAACEHTSAPAPQGFLVPLRSLSLRSSLLFPSADWLCTSRSRPPFFEPQRCVPVVLELAALTLKGAAAQRRQHARKQQRAHPDVLPELLQHHLGRTAPFQSHRENLRRIFLQMQRLRLFLLCQPHRIGLPHDQVGWQPRNQELPAGLEQQFAATGSGASAEYPAHSSTADLSSGSLLVERQRCRLANRCRAKLACEEGGESGYRPRHRLHR